MMNIFEFVGDMSHLAATVLLPYQLHTSRSAAAIQEESPYGDEVNLCDDPDMKGLSRQKIDWSGVNGGWYRLVKNVDADLHVNVLLRAPFPEELPDRQLVTGLSIISRGHSLVVEGEIVPGGRIELSAANLPVECWEFGGDAIWARHYAKMTAQGRRMETGESFKDRVSNFEHTAAHDWCTQNIVENGLSDVQSSNAIFRIATPAVVVRLNVGIGHRTGGELERDDGVLPDLDVWQMDVGLVGLSVESEALTGSLAEMARPV